MEDQKKASIIFSSYRNISTANLARYLDCRDILTKSFLHLEPFAKEKPQDFVIREAESNARLLFHSHEAQTALSISNIISCGTRILRVSEKLDIRKILKLLSGRRHKLVTASSFQYKLNSQVKTKNILATNIVKIKRFERREIEIIIDSAGNEPIFYFNEFIGSRYINFTEGSYGNIDGSYNYELNFVGQILSNL